MPQTKPTSANEGNDQKSPSNKAAVGSPRPVGRDPCWRSRAYSQYVSTAMWRERRLACPILKGGPFVFNIPCFVIFLLCPSPCGQVGGRMTPIFRKRLSRGLCPVPTDKRRFRATHDTSPMAKDFDHGDSRE